MRFRVKDFIDSPILVYRHVSVIKGEGQDCKPQSQASPNIGRAQRGPWEHKPARVVSTLESETGNFRQPGCSSEFTGGQHTKALLSAWNKSLAQVLSNHTCPAKRVTLGVSLPSLSLSFPQKRYNGQTLGQAGE